MWGEGEAEMSLMKEYRSWVNAGRPVRFVNTGLYRVTEDGMVYRYDEGAGDGGEFVAPETVIQVEVEPDPYWDDGLWNKIKWFGGHSGHGVPPEFENPLKKLRPKVRRLTDR